MGLDMNLYKKHYVKNWSFEKAGEKKEVTATKGGKPIKGLKPERVAYVTENVMYWRKANAIHDWFVKNAQDGEDDCRNAYVSFEQLEELRDTCKKVLDSIELVDGKVKNGSTITRENGKMVETPNMEDGKYIKDTTICEELLPTAEGFFFGGTDYDEYYYNDIKETYEKLTELLAEEEADRAEYEYHSSW